MSIMRSGTLLATCAAAALVSACTGGGREAKPATAASSPAPAAGNSSRPARGVITGHLLAVGGPAAVAPRPLPGRVEAVGAGATWQDASVTGDGEFRISVSPGTYTMAGTSPLYNSGHAVCRAQQPATVSAGEAVTVDIYCQER